MYGEMKSESSIHRDYEIKEIVFNHKYVSDELIEACRKIYPDCSLIVMSNEETDKSNEDIFQIVMI